VQAVKLDGTEFAGRWLDITLYVKYFRPVRRARKNRVRISGLPFEADTSDVQAMLDTLGAWGPETFTPLFLVPCCSFIVSRGGEEASL
jgi:hypothetical protein